MIYLKTGSKKKLLFTFSLLLSLTSFVSLHAVEYGDVNNDNTINIVDALMVAQYAVGFNPSNFYRDYADANGDGSVNIVDALMIAQYTVGLIPVIPGPSHTPIPTAPPTQAPTPTSNAVSAVFPYAPYFYPYGFASVASNQNTENNYVRSEYNSWKSAYVTSNGAGGNLRVRRPQDSDDSVSEGIAYGMLFAVYMDDRTALDGLWNYAKAHLDKNGLMNWQINSSGTVIGQNAATDADQDMALALIFAEKKWGGSGYRTDAMNVINAMWQFEVENGNVLKPGDAWGGSTCINISYFFPAAYKIFAGYTGQSGWNNVVNKCYEIIEAVQQKRGSVLVPDWCTASGDSTSLVDWDQWKDEYYYDAVRYPWRISIDYLWNGDSRAYENSNAATVFFENKGVANIVNGYYLNGNAFGDYHDPCFIATAGAGAMASGRNNFAAQMYIETKNNKNNQYYQDCLRLFALMSMTGNFPNLLTR